MFYQVRASLPFGVLSANFDKLENANKCFDKHMNSIIKYDFPISVRMIKDDDDNVVVIKEGFNGKSL